ncbi:hypothetical protein C6497_14240 [Candidatus Poribacteria bacterium]|nr:MAG: hypothetical protein C6497_14240 [Candidatus Poribacteria bacterium]
MRSFFLTLSILSSLIGLFFIFRGWIHPTLYNKELSKENTTAVRVTQVYTEATYRVVLGIGFTSFGIFTAITGFLISSDKVRKEIAFLIDKITKNTSVSSEIDESQDEKDES